MNTNITTTNNNNTNATKTEDFCKYVLWASNDDGTADDICTWGPGEIDEDDITEDTIYDTLVWLAQGLGEEIKLTTYYIDAMIGYETVKEICRLYPHEIIERREKADEEIEEITVEREYYIGYYDGQTGCSDLVLEDSLETVTEEITETCEECCKSYHDEDDYWTEDRLFETLCDLYYDGVEGLLKDAKRRNNPDCPVSYYYYEKRVGSEDDDYSREICRLTLDEIIERCEKYLKEE